MDEPNRAGLITPYVVLDNTLTLMGYAFNAKNGLVKYDHFSEKNHGEVLPVKLFKVCLEEMIAGIITNDDEISKNITYLFVSAYEWSKRVSQKTNDGSLIIRPQIGCEANFARNFSPPRKILKIVDDRIVPAQYGLYGEQLHQCLEGLEPIISFEVDYEGSRFYRENLPAQIVPAIVDLLSETATRAQNIRRGRHCATLPQHA